MEGESSVEKEYHILKELVDIAGLPRVHWFGRESNYNALVIDFFWPLVAPAAPTAQEILCLYCSIYC